MRPGCTCSEDIAEFRDLTHTSVTQVFEGRGCVRHGWVVETAGCSALLAALAASDYPWEETEDGYDDDTESGEGSSYCGMV